MYCTVASNNGQPMRGALVLTKEWHAEWNAITYEEKHEATKDAIVYLNDQHEV